VTINIVHCFFQIQSIENTRVKLTNNNGNPEHVFDVLMSEDTVTFTDVPFGYYTLFVERLGWQDYLNRSLLIQSEEVLYVARQVGKPLIQHPDQFLSGLLDFNSFNFFISMVHSIPHEGWFTVSIFNHPDFRRALRFYINGIFQSLWGKWTYRPPWGMVTFETLDYRFTVGQTYQLKLVYECVDINFEEIFYFDPFQEIVLNFPETIQEGYTSFKWELYPNNELSSNFTNIRIRRLDIDDFILPSLREFVVSPEQSLRLLNGWSGVDIHITYYSISPSWRVALRKATWTNAAYYNGVLQSIQSKERENTSLRQLNINQ
jgi:hypothetical protein